MIDLNRNIFFYVFFLCGITYIKRSSSSFEGSLTQNNLCDSERGRKIAANMFVSPFKRLLNSFLPGLIAIYGVSSVQMAALLAELDALDIHPRALPRASRPGERRTLPVKLAKATQGTTKVNKLSSLRLTDDVMLA